RRLLHRLPIVDVLSNPACRAARVFATNPNSDWAFARPASPVRAQSSCWLTSVAIRSASAPSFPRSTKKTLVALSIKTGNITSKCSYNCTLACHCLHDGIRTPFMIREFYQEIGRYQHRHDGEQADTLKPECSL